MQQPPEDAAHEHQRDKHRHERQGHRHDGEADFTRAWNAASRTGMPASMCRTMFSSITMASSTTKPTESVERQQREIVERIAEEIHRHKRAEQRHRDRHARDDRRPDGAQKQENHEHDQRDGKHQGGLHVMHRIAHRFRVVAQNTQLHRLGQLLGKQRQQRTHAGRRPRRC